MVGDVLSALRDCAALERTIVITCEESVAAAARYLGAIVVPDTAEQGQSAAVARGFERAVPRASSGRCASLATARRSTPARSTRCWAPPHRTVRTHATPAVDSRREIVIVPDRHGTGTNGLLLTPPGAIPPSFGPDSFERHRQLAREAGVACRVERVPSLLLDIDTGADLAVLRERLAGRLGPGRDAPARCSARGGLGLAADRALDVAALRGEPPRVWFAAGVALADVLDQPEALEAREQL